MLISHKQQIEDAIIKNLLSAHERLAGSGSAADLIRLSKYIFRLAKKREDVLVDIVPEGDQEGGERMESKDYTIDDLQVVADEVIDMLRPKHLTFEDIRLLLKIIDENLEYEVLRERVK